MKAIHLIAPSGACLDGRKPAQAIEWLKQQGISVQNTGCVERVHQRFAGSDTERLAELNALVSLPSDTVVMAARGGYGLHRLLPNIAWDSIAKSVENGLQICGHSDLTVFHLGLLAKTGAISLAGPMLNFDFGQLDEEGVVTPPNPFMWAHFQRAIDSRSLDVHVNTSQGAIGRPSEGVVSGMLWGGNLTVVAGLIGTPYMPNAQQIQGGILFLEDVNEHPYRVERMLMQLLDSEILTSQAAIVLGGFSAYRLYENDRGYNLEVVIDYLRQRLPESIPVLTDLPFGHQADKVTLPVGAKARLVYNKTGFSLKALW